MYYCDGDESQRVSDYAYFGSYTGACNIITAFNFVSVLFDAYYWYLSSVVANVFLVMAFILFTNLKNIFMSFLLTISGLNCTGACE